MTTLTQQPTTSNPEPRVSLAVAHMVANSLKAAQPLNDSLWRALDKAIELMEQGHPMELCGNVLHVASASRQGIDYATMLNECGCETQAGVCWHRAACAVFVAMQTIEAAAQICQPLVAQPRRKRRPTTAVAPLAGVEVRAAMQASRTSRGPMSDDEYRRACELANDLF